MCSGIAVPTFGALDFRRQRLKFNGCLLQISHELCFKRVLDSPSKLYMKFDTAPDEELNISYMMIKETSILVRYAHGDFDVKK